MWGLLTVALYRAYAYNLSAPSLGWRLFSGTGVPEIRGVQAAPIFYSPRLAVITSILLTGAALILGLAAAIKTHRYGKAGENANFDLAFAMMICVCLLASPMIWPHYLIILALPLTVIARRLRELGFPRRQTLFCVVAILILLIPAFALEDFILSFSSAPNIVPNETGVRPDTPVSFAAGLIFLLPTLSAPIILLLARRLARMSGEKTLPQA